MKTKRIQKIISAQATQDGDGVKIHRLAGQANHPFMDPFLMIDEINSDDAADYIGGFPPHPHRGFETVTYMIQGKFQHRDSMGNQGIISSGGVQWMKAASGVIHAEMPMQQNGQLHGFQLWLNLASEDKMSAPSYRDISAKDIPNITIEQGVQIKAIAGRGLANNQAIAGLIDSGKTQAVIWHVTLAPEQVVELQFNPEYQLTSYVFQGSTSQLKQRQAAMFGLGEYIQLQAGKNGAEILLVGGMPLREPVVQYGPFVMNSMSEINQAMQDYQQQRLVQDEIAVL